MSGPGFKKVDPTPPNELQALLQRVKELEAEVQDKSEKLTVAEASAKLLAEGQIPFMQSSMEEQPTGKKLTVKRAINPWVKDASKLKFEEVEMPTYYYKIDLPASGGVALNINGEMRYHGQTYEFTLDDLRMIKDMVARAWGHEANIRGSNENVFRRPHNMQLSGKAH